MEIMDETVITTYSLSPEQFSEFKFLFALNIGFEVIILCFVVFIFFVLAFKLGKE